jgi:hypothetical protein
MPGKGYFGRFDVDVSLPPLCENGGLHISVVHLKGFDTTRGLYMTFDLIP